METFARSLLVFSIALVLSVRATAAEWVGDGCGFSVQSPDDITLERDTEAIAPICQYLEKPVNATPFSNGVRSLQWHKLSNFKVNEVPMRDLGFFRLSPTKSVTHIGRPSYDDTRNSYSQAVLRSTVRRSVRSEKPARYTVTSEVKVSWPEPISSTEQKESTNTYTCIDSAIYDKNRVVIVNWCAIKSNTSIPGIQNMIKSLRLSE